MSRLLVFLRELAAFQSVAPFFDPRDARYRRYPRPWEQSLVRRALIGASGMALTYLTIVIKNLVDLAGLDIHFLIKLDAVTGALLLPQQLTQFHLPVWVIYFAAILMCLATLVPGFFATQDEILEQRVIWTGDVITGNTIVSSDDNQGNPLDLALLPEPKLFVGRMEECAWLEQQLSVSGGPSTKLVYGMGGIGKTALAAVVVRKLHSAGQFPDGIGVVRCSDYTDAIEILRAVLARFHPRRRQPEATDLTNLSQVAKQRLTGKQAIVVLENVEPNVDAHLLDIFQILAATGVRTLVTSREPLPRRVIPEHSKRKLGYLSPTEALELFATTFLTLGSPARQRRRGEKLPPSEHDAAVRIVKALQGHTLAVKLAGAYAGDARRRDLAKLATELEYVASGSTDDNVPRELRSVYNFSTLGLSDDAKRMFACLAAFGTEEFSMNAALKLGGPLGISDPEECLNESIRRALVESYVNIEPPTGQDLARLRLHPLLRTLAGGEFAVLSVNDHTTAYSTIAQYYANYALSTTDAVKRRDEDNITEALRWACGQSMSERLVLDLCYGMHKFWRDRGRFGPILEFLPRGIDAADKLRRKSQLNTLDREHAVDIGITYGRILQLTGSLDAAEEVFLLNLRYSQDSPEYRKGQGEVLSRLGQLARARGRTADAENYFTRTLAIARSISDAKLEGTCLGYLGRIERLRGHLIRAEQYFAESFAVAERVGDERGRAAVQAQRGRLALVMGQPRNARGYFEESLRIHKEQQDRRGEGAVIHQLGHVALAHGRLDAASRRFEESLAIAREVHETRGEAESLSDLGKIAQEGGDIETAVGYYQHALGMFRQSQDRLNEGVVLLRLGTIAEVRSDIQTAESNYRDSLAIAREVQNAQGIADGLLAHGRLLVLHRGKRVDGCALLADAVRLYTEMEIPNEAHARRVARELHCSN